jgi:hypothetical protein
MRRQARILVGTTIFLAFITAAPLAEAHLLKVTDLGAKTKLEKRRSSQLWNLRHARYVAQYGKGANRVWHRKAAVWIARELAETELALKPPVLTPTAAIRSVFGIYGDQAVRVSYCETGGTFDVNATNGQYLGLFQMGSYARRQYGHAGDALGQSRAAYRYFVDSGRDWSPWSCKP